MNIIILTTKRSRTVIHKTIKSIWSESSDPIILMAGGTDHDYLKRYRNNPHIIIVDNLNEKEATLNDGVQRAAWGYCSCLRFKPEGTLIVEDDVILKKGWYATLTAFLATLGDSKYIVSLTIPFADSIASPNIDVPSLQLYEYAAKLVPDATNTHYALSVRTFANTSAVYYPPSVLKTDLADFVEENVVNGEGVYDLAIGHYLFDQKIPIYVSVPALAVNKGNTISAMGTPEKRHHVDYVFGGINVTR